jgi:hypothetical protein
LLCARGIERFRLPLRVSSLIVVLGLATISLLAYYGRAPERQTIAKADALRAAADGDLILCTGFTRNALEYQVRVAGGGQRFLSFPRSSGEHRGWVDERALADPSYVRSDAIALMESLDRAMNSDDRLWIAHARELAGANDVLMREVEQRFQQIPCAANGEARGFTCWRKRSGDGPRS